MARPLLLSCEAVSKAFGTRPLFDDLSFGLFEGDQAGLVGPNGSGKSTLLKILAGLETPDRGARSLRGGVRVGYVPQDPVFPAARTVADVVAGRAGRRGRGGPARPHGPGARPGRLRGRSRGDRHALRRLAQAAGHRPRAGRRARPPADGRAHQPPRPGGHPLAGGLLAERARAYLVVSHDRYFLEHVATRMLELNRVYPGGFFETDGRYSEFLERRDEFLRGQAAYQESLANPVRREIEWLRRGAKARSTKAKGRIKEAGRLMEELEDGRARGATRHRRASTSPPPAADAAAAGGARARRSRSAAAACSAASTSCSRPARASACSARTAAARRRCSTCSPARCRPTPARSSAPTACGSCSSSRSAAVSTPTQSLRRALAPEGDAVTWQGRSVHVAAWAKRFLFRPEQLDVPVGRLSGGEQARILIARLMREPADLLILDEPTNDLDIPTLEVLEDSLAEFPGGLVLVTHDRFMLDRVSTVILALDGRGGTETFADYAQWEAARAARAPGAATSGRARSRAGACPDPTTRLS